MYSEAEEAPMRVFDQLQSNALLYDALGQRLRDNPPPLVVTCGRGSSDHAATYAKYMIETNTGIPTLSSAPSVNSLFATKLSLKGALFIAISQSGQSPDILQTTQAAKDSGAYILSIVNDSLSPLAALSDLVIPLHAGPEKSVAATKSYICSLTAIASLVARWTKNPQLTESLNSLPSAMKEAFAQNWSSAMDAFMKASSLFVISRGYGLGIAQEAALKFKETCSLHAEAFSAAEVIHGPMTLVKKGFPILMLSVQDQSQSSVDDAATTFIEHSAQVFTAGQSYAGAHSLGITTSPLAELRPILLIQSFYKFVNALAIARGYDPDCPAYLHKVTETL